MKDDRLDRAIAAYRETTRRGSEGMEASLVRLGWQRARKARPARLHMPLLAAAVLLGGAVSWASTSGHLKRWVAELTDAAPAEPSPVLESPTQVAPRRKPSLTNRVPVAPSSPLLEAEDSLPVVESAAVEAPLPMRVPAERKSPPKLKPIPEDPSTAVEEESLPEQEPAAPSSTELYQRAHRIHFGQRDYAAALGAWDEYLRRAEAGDRWLPEARFNRAVALARLGRHSEAKAALLPFSEGAYGGYHREDAKKLIERISQSGE